MASDHDLAVESNVSGIVQYREALARLLRENEGWLTQRILYYAKRHGYAQYKSPLPEPWRLSIEGLSASMVAAVDYYRGIPELQPENTHQGDPVAQFGILEAQRHRSRGLNLAMFLGLYKYYQQAYTDLLHRALLSEQERALCLQFIVRVFDCIEIAFCVEWASHPLDGLIGELQAANRTLMNQKNAFLTVFESLRSPVILLDSDGRIWMLNQEASRLASVSAASGPSKYGNTETTAAELRWQSSGEPVEALFPWLPSREELLDEAAPVDTFECTARVGDEDRTFEGRVSRLLDAGDRVMGSVVVLNDVSEHKALTCRLERLARTDALTGTNNRRSFMETAKNEVRRARRHARQLSVLAIDVDHFKAINDRCGHDGGDQVLISLTQAAQTTLRTTDTLGRLGGEEFAILLPETSEAAAVTAAERVRAAIAGLCVRTAAGPLRVTASIGIASLTRADHSFEELLRRADNALYQAKAAGRNRVVPAETSLGSPEAVEMDPREAPSGIIARCSAWQADAEASGLQGGKPL